MYDINGNFISETNRLYGKYVCAIGDSYVSGNSIGDANTWLNKLASRNNMTFNNLGLNGETLIDMVGNERYTNIPSSADYIIAFTGHNDSSALKEIGTASDISANTFMGAMNVLCKWLMNNRPKARTLFITPTHRTGKEPDYVKSMMEVCANYGINCWNAYENLGILINKQKDVDQQSTFEQIYNGNYVLHLNALGHEYISYKIEEQLKML